MRDRHNGVSSITVPGCHNVLSFNEASCKNGKVLVTRIESSHEDFACRGVMPPVE